MSKLSNMLHFGMIVALFAAWGCNGNPTAADAVGMAGSLWPSGDFFSSACETDDDCFGRHGDFCYEGYCTHCVTDDHCDSDEPVCDPLADKCVECLQNADCTDLATPTCTYKSKCVQCVLDSDCVANGLGGVCHRNSCYECMLHEDCGGDTPVCNDSRECVECEYDHQCTDPDKPTCQDSQCV